MTNGVRNKAASVRARIMNIARKEGVDFDTLLLRYVQERFLYRLSVSEFSDRLILKGGLFLVCLNMPVLRPTKDIDFLAEHLKNDPGELEKIIRIIAEISCDDGIKFHAPSIESERIKEDADYEGIRLKIDASLGQAKKKMKIDIGFGDIIVPKAASMEFPSLLEEKPPVIKTYSIESVIAEKFEAMIKLAMVNSRMRDFYDIYTLSQNHKIDRKKLRKAIDTTFKRRKTSMPDNPFIFQARFYEDKEKQTQWTAFLRKSRLENISRQFSEVMEGISELLKPIVIQLKE